jgi:hypothetical protein
MRPLSDPAGAYGCTKALRAAAEAGGGLTSSLTCFHLAVGNRAVAGLFVPVLILSTPTLGAIIITVIFGTIVPKGARGFGRSPTLAATLVFGVDFAKRSFR